MTVNINLLPWREEQKEFDKKRLMMLMVGVSGIAIALILLVHAAFQYKISSQRRLNDYLNVEINSLNQQIGEINALQKEKQELLARMNIIQQLQINRSHTVRLFDNLVRTIPEGLYLTSLARLDDRISIEGRAESNTRVSTFMRNIEASNWLSNPILNVIQADDKKKNDSMIDFTLHAVQMTKEK
jgi:type IV pilus assembly protein PilN